MSQRYIADQLLKNGYVLLPRWRCEETTIAIGRSIGSVVNVPKLLSRDDIPIVQTLKPCGKAEASKNQYSGNYGLNEFPLHTDLAHWAIPPRYLMLRCQKSSWTVATRLLASSTLASMLDTTILRQALVRPRRPGRNGILCLLPLTFYAEGISGIRWDPLFLIPMNEAAGRVAKTMLTHDWQQSKLISLTLAEPGDTLILDNWRILHGRSKISRTEIDRRLERIYLSEVYA